MKNKSQRQEQKQNIVNVETMVRLRPLIQSEMGQKQSIIFLNEKKLEIRMSGGKRNQTAQRIFSPSSTQRQIFNSLQPFLGKCGQGFNVTVFTYGQTGSGKTYTMFGSDWSNILKKRNNEKSKQSTFLRSIQQDQNHAGLIPRTVNYIFNEIIDKRRKHIKVFCSFLQLYNETMMDLFEDDKQKINKKMMIHQNKEDGIYVEGLNEIQISSVDQCLQMMQKGQKNRVVRQTHMNVKSSRSHTIFQLLIEEVFPSKKTYRRMKVNLCDLAGSEKINKMDKMQQQHFQQLKNINLSLTTLGKVISSLSDRDHKKNIPPFRQSKLTRLLQDSLGGNTYTTIIATITSKSSCLEESMNTLKFLQRAKQIKSAIAVKVFSDNPEMRNLQKQIAYLKDVLKMKRTGVQIDVGVTEKLKKLQQENQKLKQMVDKQLVQKLIKQNTHLKIALQMKKNDELMQSQGSSNFQTINPKFQYTQKQTPLREHEQSDKASQYKTNFQTSKVIPKQRKLLSTKTYTTKHNDNLSTKKANSTKFPSIKTISSSSKSPTSILQRIHEIQRVKQANKLKLEQQLSLIGQTNSLGNQKQFHGLKKNASSSNRYRFQ